MKLGCGGFRPAFNVQFATGTDHRVIYGVQVVNTLDPGCAGPMMAQVKTTLQHIGQEMPNHWVADSAYGNRRDIEHCGLLFPEVTYVAASTMTGTTESPQPVKGDSKYVLEWKSRVGQPEFQEVYAKRCSSAEFSNMHVKNRGMRKFRTRGLAKVTGEAFLHAIAQNMQRAFCLQKQKHHNS